MLPADTLSRHHLEHSACDTEKTPESTGNVEDKDNLEEINELLTSENHKCQDIHPSQDGPKNPQV